MIANVGSRWVDGNLEFFDVTTGTTLLAIKQGEPITNVAGQAAEADIATPDASAQTAGYVQADVESIRDLANANKSKINALLAKLRLAKIIGS